MKAYQVQITNKNKNTPLFLMVLNPTSSHRSLHDFIIYDNNPTTNMVCPESRLPRLPSPILSSTSVLTSLNDLTKFKPRMKPTNGSRASNLAQLSVIFKNTVGGQLMWAISLPSSRPSMQPECMIVHVNLIHVYYTCFVLSRSKKSQPWWIFSANSAGRFYTSFRLPSNRQITFWKV